MMDALVALLRQLPPLPSERTLAVKLFYHDDVTPSDWQPLHFADSTHDEAHHFAEEPRKLDVGAAATQHHAMSLRVAYLARAVAPPGGAAASPPRVAGGQEAQRSAMGAVSGRSRKSRDAREECGRGAEEHRRAGTFDASGRCHGRARDDASDTPGGQHGHTHEGRHDVSWRRHGRTQEVAQDKCGIWRSRGLGSARRPCARAAATAPRRQRYRAHFQARAADTAVIARTGYRPAAAMKTRDRAGARARAWAPGCARGGTAPGAQRRRSDSCARSHPRGTRTAPCDPPGQILARNLTLQRRFLFNAALAAPWRGRKASALPASRYRRGLSPVSRADAAALWGAPDGRTSRDVTCAHRARSPPRAPSEAYRATPDDKIQIWSNLALPR
jgi:hypothetical protein